MDLTGGSFCTVVMVTWIRPLTSNLDLVTDLSVLFLTFLATLFALIQVRNYLLAFLYHLYDAFGDATGVWEPRIDAKAVRNPSVNDDHIETVSLAETGSELVYLRIVFEPILFFGLRFKILRWWIELPDGFRVFRRTDVESLSASDGLPEPAETSLNTDAVKINPDEDAVYDNLAFGYLESKHYVLKRNYVRGEVRYFGTKNNRRVHIPLWLHTPDISEWTQADATADHPDGRHTIGIEIDPPHLPYKNRSEIRVELRAPDD
jgi:hypothetical protein